MRTRFSLPLALALVVALLPRFAAAGDERATFGAFSAPFAEPTINGIPTDERCVENSDGKLDCKPAAGSLVQLANGNLLYWNALEGTENVDQAIAFEFGKDSANDQSRVLDLGGDKPVWREPSPKDGGASNKGSYVLPGEFVDDPEYNSGALFCPSVVQLADGRILVVGGTDYYNEPSVPGTEYGLVELEGLRAARIFDPDTEAWVQSSDMHYGRWYPTAVTLGDGKVFVASGVTKLIKPVYPDRDVTDSGTNVRQTEVYDPETATWTENGERGERSLPLYPRLHLLPNGQVFFNAAGQAFNPSGQSYDEALWNIAAAYDPATNTWTDLGVPALNTLTPGFRGSTFSIMLPLEPEKSGLYTKARFLTGGGVVAPTPGSYLPVNTSVITTVDTSGGTTGGMTMTSEETGAMNHARWYSAGVLLPDGSVLAFSGANRDEVVFPGTGNAITQPELFDPQTKTWRPVAKQGRERTYHNSAVLLPDGRVLVAGHAPITTMYGNNTTLPGGFSPNDGRDPSFEIYSPPYLFRGDRPAILGAPEEIRHGQSFAVAVDDAAAIESVVLVRNAAQTHLVDADQRAVKLPFERRGDALIVTAPRSGDVAPAGPYLLFVNKQHRDGPVPSVAAQLSVVPA